MNSLRSAAAPDFPPRQASHPPSRLGSVLKFGLTDQELKDYESTISKVFPDMKQKYGAFDMKGGYRLLSFEMKRIVNSATRWIQPNTIVAYSQRHLLGKTEEAADAIFELWDKRVWDMGLIKQAQVDRWGAMVGDFKRDGRSFSEFLRTVESELSQENLRHFERMTRLQPDQAKEMLALVGCKLALFKDEKPDFNVGEHLKPLLRGEIEELFEDRPKWSIGRNVMLGLSKAFSEVPILPSNWYSRIMMAYLHHKVHLPVQYDEVVLMPRMKMLNRQNMHYNWDAKGADPKKAYNDRKACYKGFEVIMETGILDQAERRLHTNA